MPKVAIFFFALLVFPILTDSYASIPVDLNNVDGIHNTLEEASGKIDESINTISTSVKFISEASSQLNSLLFPIIASIGIIVALQIAILARRR